MTRFKKSEVITSIIFFAFGLILYTLASNLNVPGRGGWMLNAAVWPKWIGILIMIFSIIMGFQSQRQEDDSEVNLLPEVKSWLMIGSFIIYIISMPLFGYFIGSIILVTAISYIAGERSFKILIPFSIVVSFIGYFLFWQVLSVRLPIGLLETWFKLDVLLYY